VELLRNSKLPLFHVKYDTDHDAQQARVRVDEAFQRVMNLGDPYVDTGPSKSFAAFVHMSTFLDRAVTSPAKLNISCAFPCEPIDNSVLKLNCLSDCAVKLTD
jgi:hypothetical protein